MRPKSMSERQLHLMDSDTPMKMRFSEFFEIKVTKKRIIKLRPSPMLRSVDLTLFRNADCNRLFKKKWVKQGI